MPRIKLLSSVEKVKWPVCNLGRMFRDLVVVVVVQMVLLLLLLWEDGVGEQENIVFRENLYRETRKVPTTVVVDGRYLKYGKMFWGCFLCDDDDDDGT